MITLTAIIHCKPGSEERIRAALAEVGRHAHEHEPGTASFFVTEVPGKGIFVTHERFADQAAMDAHNEGPGSRGFFAVADGHLESVDVHIGGEVFCLE